VLGIGSYSREIQLMATNPPLKPGLIAKDSSRTLNSIDIKFILPLSDGGSKIIGY